MRWVVVLCAMPIAALLSCRSPSHATHGRVGEWRRSAFDAETGETVPGLLAWIASRTDPGPVCEPVFIVRDGTPFDPMHHRPCLVGPNNSLQSERRVTVWAPGYKLAVVEEFPVRLERAEAGELKVVDNNGAPIVGAQVYSYPLGPKRPARERLVTDDEGKVSFDRAGDSMLVRAPGYGDVLVDRGEVAVTMTSAYPLAGVVVGSSDIPVGGARVHVNGSLAHAVFTDRDGRFGFGSLNQRRAKVTVSADGFADAIFECWTGDNSVKCVLRRFAQIEGVVVDQDGKPAWAWIRGHAATDKDGKFRLKVPPGRHVIDPRLAVSFLFAVGGEPTGPRACAGLESAPHVVRVAEGEVRTGLVVRLHRIHERAATLRLIGADGKIWSPGLGFVQIARLDRFFVPARATLDSRGRPIVSARSHGEDSFGELDLRTSEAGDAGIRIHWSDRELRTARLRVSIPHYLPELLVVRDGEKHEIRLRRGIVVRFVCDGPVDLEGDCCQLGDKRYGVDPEGVCRLTAGEGSRRLVVEGWRPPAGGGDVALKIEPVAPPERRTTRQIRGRVLDQYGRTLGGAAVRVGRHGKPVVTRPDGAYAVRAAGTDVLWVERRGMGTVLSAGRGGDVVLRTEGSLRIFFEFPKVWHMSDWRVDIGRRGPRGGVHWDTHVVDRDGGLTRVADWRPHPVVSDGIMEPHTESLVHALGPGALHVKLWSSNFAMTKRVKVEPGRTSVVVFDVR